MALDEISNMDPIDGAFSFIENSYLSYIIPRATDLDLEEVSQDLEDTGALFETIEKRQSLYFGG
jgi:hypothetical protein